MLKLKHILASRIYFLNISYNWGHILYSYLIRWLTELSNKHTVHVILLINKHTVHVILLINKQQTNALFANQWRPCEQNNRIINLYTTITIICVWSPDSHWTERGRLITVIIAVHVIVGFFYVVMYALFVLSLPWCILCKL
jgi:hypothetical protein